MVNLNEKNKIAGDVAVFGGGCFWCTETVFSGLRGITEVMPGYSGGTVKNPTYEEVCTGDTGHAEVIRIKFEPARISYGDLLKVFFATHNPTTVNRQGNDTGPQYRSVIFYATTAQRVEAEKFIRDLKSIYRINAVTRVEPLVEFYPAEDYHRNYYVKNQNAPYCQFVIDPKLAKLREQFKYLLNI